MTPETPLSEVAHHLPSAAAEHLLGHDPWVQEATLKQIRVMVAFWEDRGHVFDPVAYEGILMAVVASTAALYEEGAQLSSRTLAAEALTRALTAQIVAHVCNKEQL